jgi:hypothetical protein
VDREHAEQVELDRREVDVLAVARDPARGEVDRDRAGADDGIGAVRRVAAAQTARIRAVSSSVPNGFVT